MTPERAMLAISLFAAFADGANDDREREHIRQFAESLGAQAPELARLYQDVLLKRLTLEEVIEGLPELGQRQYAYEMAVCVCDADGRQSEAEKNFLARLKTLLDLAGDAEVTQVESQAEALADLDRYLPSPNRDESAPANATSLATAGMTTTPSSLPEAELDKSILNYSILNGALELLPQSWASVAIIPLQIKMVYRIGKAYGYELDQGHIKEFLATVGIGLTSQYLEQFGRKLLGGFLGKLGGKSVGKIGKAAAGMAFSFATTYALGQIAKRYYAGGRQMSSAVLQQSFQNLLGPAQEMQRRYLPQIQERAATLDASQIMTMVRAA